MTIAERNLQDRHFLEHTYPFITYMSEDRFLSRPTQLVNDPLSLVYPFPTAAWVLLGIATILSIFMALIFTCVYRRCEMAKGELVHEKTTLADIAFKMLGSLTEPDFLGFFPSWSAGPGMLFTVVHKYKNNFPFLL